MCLSCLSIILWTERPPVRFQVSTHAGQGTCWGFWLDPQYRVWRRQPIEISLSPFISKETHKNIFLKKDKKKGDKFYLLAHLKRHRMSLDAEAILYRMSSFNHTKSREANDCTTHRKKPKTYKEIKVGMLKRKV